MKCFFHSADLDGHCSGAVVKHRFPNVELFPINYGQEFPWNKIDDVNEAVYMVDFCLQPFEHMERLNGMCKLHWIDHHKVAIDDAEKRRFKPSGGQLIMDGRGACCLTWNYLYQNRILPDTVQFLALYDVWDHTHPSTLPFQYGFRFHENTMPGSPEADLLWEQALDYRYDVGAIVESGKLLLEYERRQNAKFCNAYVFETKFCLGHKDCPTECPTHMFSAICANRGFTNSKLFDSAYDPERHHLMITFQRLKLPARKWTVSLYSTRDDVDCGEIAKSFGGGGHKGAAGFQCDVLPFDH
jgi:uncharacterized protein